MFKFKWWNWGFAFHWTKVAGGDCFKVKNIFLDEPAFPFKSVAKICMLWIPNTRSVRVVLPFIVTFGRSSKLKFISETGSLIVNVKSIEVLSKIVESAIGEIISICGGFWTEKVLETVSTVLTPSEAMTFIM